MECAVCQNEVKIHNSVVCGERCGKIRAKMFDITNKYFPKHGCENCWGDLYKGCSEECKKESNLHFALYGELWDLIHLIFPHEGKKVE